MRNSAKSITGFLAANAARRRQARAVPSHLLLVLVNRCSFQLFRWLGARWAAFQRWRKARSQEQSTHMEFEALEPRVLLSGDFAPAVADSAAAGPNQVQRLAEPPAINLLLAADVAAATVQVTGAGSAQLVDQGAGLGLMLTGTNADSIVTLQPRTAGSHVLLTGITADSAVGQLSLANADLQGSARLAGGVGTLVLGDVVGATIQVAGSGDFSLQAHRMHNSFVDAAGAVAAISADSFTADAAGGASIRAAGLDSLRLAGQMSGDLFVLGGSRLRDALGTVDVAGAVTRGLWTVEGRGRTINVQSTGAEWRMNIGGTLLEFATAGDASGSMAMASVQQLSIGGSMRNLVVYVGADLGGDAALGGSGDNADHFDAGRLARLRVGGAIVDSSVYISIDPVDGVFGNGDDLDLGTAVQRVQEIVFTTAGQPQLRLVAPGFPTTVNFGGQNLDPDNQAALDNTKTEKHAPVVSAKLRNDTGVAADDGLTSDPSIALTVTDAGKVTVEGRAAGQPFQAIVPVKLDGDRYVVTAEILNRLNGGRLPDGSLAFEFRATDKPGNVSNPAGVQFTLDTSPPVLTRLAVDASNGTDLSTTADVVKVIGVAEAGLAVTLRRTLNGPALATTSTAADGSFSFDRVSVPVLGANGFVLVLTDRAGNRLDRDFAITRTAADAVAPVVTAALQADTGASASDGVTREAAVTGTATDNVAVTRLEAMLDPSPTSVFSNVTASLQSGGAFVLSASQLAGLAGGTLVDGAHTLRLRATDAAGNSTSRDLVFTLDRVAPAISSFDLAPASDSGTAGDQVTNASAVSLTGRSEAAATVTLVRGTTTLAATTAAAEGSFTFNGVALAPGANAFDVVSTDAAGNGTTRSFVFTRDATAPTLNAALQSDTGASASDGVTREAAVTGTATDNVAVTRLEAMLDPSATSVFSNVTASLQSGGAFVLSASQLAGLAGGTLADGAHTLRLRATDAAGNSTSRDVAFTLDRVAPAIPSFDLAPASDSGTAGDQVTNASTVSLTGRSEAAATVTLVRGTTPLAVTNAAGDGSFTFNAVALAPGANTFGVVSTDAAGNSTTRSFTFTRDASAPTLNAALQSDTGVSPGDGVTREAAIVGSVADDRGVIRLEAALDPAAGSAFTNVTASLQPDGSFLLPAVQIGALAGGSLADGTHVLRLRASDAAGNSTTRDVTFTLDTGVPPVSSFGLAPASDSGTPGDRLTNAATVTLQGSTEASVPLTLMQGTTVVGTANSAGDGSFAFASVALAPGVNAFQLVAVDAAGNSATRSYSFSRDSDEPEGEVALQNDTGVSATDGITSDPAFAGVLTDASGLVRFEAALDGTGAPVFSDVSSALQGDGSFVLTAAQLALLAGGTLADGTHTLHLRATDGAGNTGAGDFAFTLDRVAPAIASLDLAAASDSGAPGDQLTNAAAVTVNGVAEAAARLTLMRGTTLLGTTTAAADGSFSFSSVALAEGSNAFSVTALDAAGNSSTRSFSFTRDSVQPEGRVALRNDTGSSASDGLTTDPTLAGSVSDNAGVVRLEAALDPAGTPVFTDFSSVLDSHGDFVLSPAQLAALAGGTLADGTHTVRMRATDRAGNSSSGDVTFTLDRSAPVVASFDLAPASDTDPAGDHSTRQSTVTLQGIAEAGAQLTLTRGALVLGFTTAAGDGSFSFGGIALEAGANALDLRATDAAGNSASQAYTFTRQVGDATAPVLTAALQSDTGRSASDGVTRDAGIAGRASDDTAVTAFEVALDPGSAPLFSDAMAQLQADGTFTFTHAQLATLAGGTLADGTHVLRLRATDAAGNSSVRDVTFTLDTQGPAAASIGVSAADAFDGFDDQTAAAIVQLRGTIEEGADLGLASQGLTARAGAGGVVVLPDVALAPGANALDFTLTDAAGNSTPVSRTITRVAATGSDAVLTWSNIALRAIQRDVTDVPIATRLLAMESLAVYDTLAAIEGTPAYMVHLSVSGPVSAQAATAVAAHRILTLHFPGQQPALDAALASSLGAIADGAAKDTGIALGRAVADAIWQLRLHDGYDAFVDFPGSQDVGLWRPVGPMFMLAQDPQWKDVTPFALDAGSQFRLPPPPALDTAAYAAAVEETKALGSATGSVRTADQTQQAHFWADGGGSYTPPGHWNQIAAEVALAHGNSLSANARLFAQLNVALADAAIACWDTKYTWDLWRPETAITNAGLDDNPATSADEAWRPLLLTPPHPEYVSGHSTFSAAAASILAATFGENTSFSTTSVTLPGVTRNFTSFTQAVDEAGRSRIYGGIHYQFSNEGGQALGREVADAVLQRFAKSQDTQAPSVLLQDTPAAAHANIAISGQVLDNLSGVAAAQYRVDGGPLQDIALGSDFRFTITTSLALDGSADGTHTVTLIARDAAGNISAGLTRSFVLDTSAPVVTLTSVPDNATLVAGTRLAGTADGGISGLTLLNYTIDGGPARSIAFDAAQSSFDQVLPYGSVDIGEHVLRVNARDASGNATTLTRTFVVDALAPFVVTDLSPAEGAAEVGVTVRPQVRFSRAVNAATLTADSFYATGPDGSRLATTIVPALDGTYAWLFFNTPMPGSSQVTVHLEGSLIRGAADGIFLDADNDGVAGGTRTASFTTVSTTTLAGTRLVGRVVDPGPDLQPMTFDDIRRGPDGIIHTPDDVFLNPIAHAKVYILGRESEFVYTDAQGMFTLENIPAGAVKLAVDGRTATNAPAGVFFPEMVMHIDLDAGVTNTVMGSMGAQAEQDANADRQEVYLPRVQASVLQSVSDTQATVVTVTDGASAPQLTAEERQALTLTIQPGTAIGESGEILTNVKVGISTVPPDLVRDMLPPGVLEHTFDITIQAPGVATFATPVKITLPNVFNAAPGSKLNILSFDHTTGMLVINGTGTVSEDGLTVVSDDDSGIRAPGWHGLTPPGGCGGSGGPPPEPTPVDPSEQVITNPAQALAFITGDAAGQSIFSRQWNAPPPLPNQPPPPPIPDCDVPPHHPGSNQDPFINVTIELDGPLADFAKQTGDLGIVGQSFTLSPGGPSKTFAVAAKSYVEMFGANGIANLNRDQLYGSKIKITTIEQKSNGDRIRTIDTFYVDRWVDVVDAPVAATLSGNTAAFLRADTDGIARQKNVDLHLASAPTTFDGPAITPFDLSGSFSGTQTAVWKFDPFLTGARTDSFSIVVTDPTDGDITVGTIVTKGTATDPTTISVNESDYKTELERVIRALQSAVSAGADATLGTADDVTRVVYDYGGGLTDATLPGADGLPGTADDVAIKQITNAAKLRIAAAPFLAQFANFLPGQAYTQAQMDAMLATEATALKDAVAADYSPVSADYQVVSGNFLADVKMTWVDLGSGLFGEANYDTQGNDSYLKGFLAMRPLAGAPTLSQAALEYALVESLNASVSNAGKFAVAININWTSGATFAQYLANTVSHELAHTFGLNDAYLNVAPFGNINPPNDIMRAGGAADADLTFAAQNIALLRAALGLQADGDTPLTAELAMYRNNINLPGSTAGARDPQMGSPMPELGIRLAAQDLLPNTALSFGEVAADGLGGAQSTLTLTLTNTGYETLDLDSLSLDHGDRGFRIVSTGIAGSTLAQDQSTSLVLAFDPAVRGQAEDGLTIATNGASVPSFHIALAGTAISATPLARVAVGGNNFGGMTLGATAHQRANVFSISNDGSMPLVISGITMTEGSGAFGLLGVPADLATTPITLARGESFSFGGTFAADQLGLLRGLVNVVTNDPAQPNLRLSLVGTGTTSLPTVQWGNDYFAINNPDLPSVPALRATSDAAGNFSMFLPAQQHYHIAGFDPATGLVTHSYGTTARSGGGTDLTATMVFGASTQRDSDGDGLPDDVEFAIGTGPGVSDTDKDGLDDFTEIQQGLDPLGGLGIPVGVVSAASLSGSAAAVAVIGSTGDPSVVTALVATDNHGLAVVDASRMTRPAVLAELDLPGTNTDVAADAQRGIAAVAGNEAGLHLVDISNPAAPVLLQTVALAHPVTHVVARDGLAFASSGNSIAMIDLNTGEVRTTLELGASANGVLDLDLEGGNLYAVDGTGSLRSIAITGNTLTIRNALQLPAWGGKVFVGGGVAYIGAGNGGIAGFVTVNIADPDHLQLLSGVDNNAVAGTALALNGSGLAVGVGSSSFVFGAFRALDVLSAADPANTGNLVTRINLPEVPRDLALANGLAFVADGTGGLQVVNYAAFDTNGVPPTLSITADGADADAATPGVQILEGRPIRVVPTITDDVQVRNVQLLVNGQVVSSDVAFPWELFAQAPLVAGGSTTMTLQVRATDTGGNVGLSNVLAVSVVPDTFPPQLQVINLEEGARRFFLRSVELTFDEPLDTARLAATGGSLLRAGADGTFGTADDVVVPVRLDTRAFGQSVSFVVDGYLPPGEYRFTLPASAVSDRAGNVLVGDIVRSFSIRPASDVRAALGVPEILTAPSANPGQQIGISVPFDPATARAQFTVSDGNGNVGTRVVGITRFDAARGVAVFTVPIDAITGDATVFSQVGGTRTDFADGTFPLQVLPVITDLQVESLWGDGSNATLLIAGTGFVDGAASEYRFGSEVVLDGSPNDGPDVFGRGDPFYGYVPNGYVRVTVPLSDGVFGPVSIRTAGGTSASYSVNLSSVTSTALRGTAANAGEASANAGQAIT
ncbi:Ig-like domain-containing protein, partial [Ramlibacter sp. XY19]|uniref:Ig-like domain-containing protein n=1 Tax=Ramlibacter paludis TaxID=2908000 RepID=UPI0023DBF5DD